MGRLLNEVHFHCVTQVAGPRAEVEVAAEASRDQVHSSVVAVGLVAVKKLRRNLAVGRFHRVEH